MTFLLQAAFISHHTVLKTLWDGPKIFFTFVEKIFWCYAKCIYYLVIIVGKMDDAIFRFEKSFIIGSTVWKCKWLRNTKTKFSLNLMIVGIHDLFEKIQSACSWGFICHSFWKWCNLFVLKIYNQVSSSSPRTVWKSCLIFSLVGGVHITCSVKN